MSDKKEVYFLNARFSICQGIMTNEVSSPRFGAFESDDEIFCRIEREDGRIFIINKNLCNTVKSDLIKEAEKILGDMQTKIDIMRNNLENS